MLETLPALSAGSAPDWYVIESWLPLWDRLRLAPVDLPGVQPLRHGLSDRKPFPREIHRTHLKQLGFTPPAIPSVSNAQILRSHQHTAVNFIRSRRGTLLADEMRLGKTAATMYAYEPAIGPMLVIGPLAARAAWSEWAHRRFGGCVESMLLGDCAMCARLGLKDPIDHPSFFSLEGRTYKPQEVVEYGARVMFCTFAVASTWRELSLSLLAASAVKKLGLLVIDECHLAGMLNRKSLTYESIQWLGTIAHRVVCLSGSPLFNRISGLWSVLDLCAPTAFGNFWDFARRFCDAKPTEHGWQANGATNERELKLRLEEIMLRRRWVDVKEDLSPIVRSIETVALTEKQRDEIEELAAQMRFRAGGMKTQVGILARLRRLFAEAKLKHGIETITTTLRDGHGCLVWVWHKDVATKLAEKLRALGVIVYGPISGGMSGKDREQTIEKARADRGTHVLIATMATLGTAVNLSFYSHEIFVELDWSPPIISQAEARPFDGIQPVSAVYLVADCPTDEALVEALLSKLENQKALGLSAGSGDVSSVLQKTFRLEGQTLDALADALTANAEGEG